MLFMTIYSWDIEKRDEIIKRRLESGRMTPDGIKMIGEWTGVSKNVGFSLFEADDPKLMAQANMAWNDILEIETVLVLDTEKDLIGLLSG